MAIRFDPNGEIINDDFNELDISMEECRRTIILNQVSRATDIPVELLNDHTDSGTIADLERYLSSPDLCYPLPSGTALPNVRLGVDTTEGGFTIDDPEVVAEMMERLRSNPYQRVVRVQVPPEQLDEFRAITSGTYSTILLSPEQVMEHRLDWEQQSVRAVDYSRHQDEYTAIVSTSFQQSGSFYGISIIGNFGIDLEEATRRFQERLNADDQLRRMFLYGEWVSDKHTEALERSRNVLIEHLDESQRKDFLRHDYFITRGSESGQLYRIRNQGSYGIELIKVGIFMCATTHKQVPIYDEMLIFKLFLETDEYGFVQQCNFKDPQEGEKAYKTIGLKQKPSWRQCLPF